MHGYHLQMVSKDALQYSLWGGAALGLAVEWNNIRLCRTNTHALVLSVGWPGQHLVEMWSML